MIARLSGTLASLDDGSALLDLPSGIAHEVLIPAYLAQRFERQVGTAVTLHTLEYLESQNQGASFIPRLIGFTSAIEREFFELLTSVKGLGNKRALRAMASEPSFIARAIHERDTRALQRLPEIGPKLAELIVHELKNKVERFTLGIGSQPVSVTPTGSPDSAAIEPKPPRSKPRVRLGEQGAPPEAREIEPTAIAPPIRQSIETLIALGEAPFEAERLVARAIDRARSAGAPVPIITAELVAAAYAAR